MCCKLGRTISVNCCLASLVGSNQTIEEQDRLAKTVKNYYIVADYRLSTKEIVDFRNMSWHSAGMMPLPKILINDFVHFAPHN